MKPVAGRQQREVLVFEVAGQRHGLPAGDVRGLIRAAAVTPFPQSPPGVEGILNLRGQVVPVIDVRRRLGLPQKALEPSDHFLVAQGPSGPVALHVDRALDLAQVQNGDIQEARNVAVGAESIHWVAKLAEHLVLIHDLNALLSWTEQALSANVPSRTDSEKPDL